MRFAAGYGCWATGANSREVSVSVTGFWGVGDNFPSTTFHVAESCRQTSTRLFKLVAFERQTRAYYFFVAWIDSM